MALSEQDRLLMADIEKRQNRLDLTAAIEAGRMTPDQATEINARFDRPWWERLRSAIIQTWSAKRTH